VTPTKKRREKEDQSGTKLLQCRISLDLWLKIETLRHQRTMAEKRTVNQAEVVEELLRKGMAE